MPPLTQAPGSTAVGNGGTPKPRSKKPEAALGAPLQGNPLGLIQPQQTPTGPSGADLFSFQQHFAQLFDKMMAEKALQIAPKVRENLLPLEESMDTLKKSSEVNSQAGEGEDKDPQSESSSEKGSRSEDETSGSEDEKVKDKLKSDAINYNIKKHLYPLALSLNPEISQSSQSPTRRDPALSYAAVKSASKKVDSLPHGAVTSFMLSNADLYLGGFYNPKRKIWEHQSRNLPSSGSILQRPYAGSHLCLQAKGSFFKGPPKDIVSPISFRQFDYKSSPDDKTVGLWAVDAFTPELAQNHQVPELSFAKDPKPHLSPATLDSWESIARSTVQALSKVEVMTTASINLVDKLLKADEPLQNPQEELKKLRALLASSFGACSNAQAFSITNLSNLILQRRDIWLSNAGDDIVKQLRIAPLFGSTLFSSDIVNRVRQDYMDYHQKNLVVNVSTDTPKTLAGYKIPKVNKPKQEKKSTAKAKQADNIPKARSKKSKNKTKTKPPKSP